MSKGMAVEIGKKLRAVREGAGKSVEDCAALLRVPADQFRAMENGDVDIAAADLYVLAKHLGCPISDFFH